METKLNIAEILKDKPKETKLYADAFGELSIEDIFVENELGINLSTKDGDDLYFYNDGKYNVHGEPILAPSKEMRDWSKFTWKRGDVLVSNDKSAHVVFKGFQDDTYKTFIGNYYYENTENPHYSFLEKIYETKDFCKEIDSDTKTYINFLEKRLGGKLNMVTLEIEPTQPEFKDGDIVFEEGNRNYCSAIGVLKKDKQGCFMFDTFLTKDKVCYNSDYIFLPIRLATDSEKQQLFDALAEEGKAWDAEKKEIVDLKPKWTPKTFDRVITRDFDDGVWSANIFSHMNSQGEYVSIGCVEGYAYCLPYNEETAKLIGTTNNAK